MSVLCRLENVLTRKHSNRMRTAHLFKIVSGVCVQRECTGGYPEGCVSMGVCVSRGGVCVWGCVCVQRGVHARIAHPRLVNQMNHRQV